MKLILLSLTALAFFLGSCERHDWEETKKLYEHEDHKKKVEVTDQGEEGQESTQEKE